MPGMIMRKSVWQLNCSLKAVKQRRAATWPGYDDDDDDDNNDVQALLNTDLAAEEGEKAEEEGPAVAVAHRPHIISLKHWR